LEHYDVVIVGAGFAGVSAAIFTGAWQLETLVLEAENPPKLWSYPMNFDKIWFPERNLPSENT